MKLLVILIVLIPVAILLMLITLSIVSQFGSVPGLQAGKLKRCPTTPNCICTEFEEDDRHYRKPVDLAKQDSGEAMAAIKAVIDRMGGNIHTADDHYLAATFRSAMFRFVDDLEVRIDADAGLIHIRSASRVGHGDSGANLNRVNRFKSIFEDTRQTA